MQRFVFLAMMVGALVLASQQQTMGDVYVRGYYRSNGTYVAPHYRSDPDGSVLNNWSTYPNVNPYTGRRGTRRGHSYYPRTRSYQSSYNYNSYRWSW